MPDYRKLVEELRDKGEAATTKLDVLRVLVVNSGTSWKSELRKDLNFFRYRTERGEESVEGFEDALQELEELEAIRCETRQKASKGESEKETLIKMGDFLKAKKALSRDEILVNYMTKMRNEIEKIGNE